jgi:hypothetical protein
LEYLAEIVVERGAQMAQAKKPGAGKKK